VRDRAYAPAGVVKSKHAAVGSFMCAMTSAATADLADSDKVKLSLRVPQPCLNNRIDRLGNRLSTFFFQE